MGYDVHLVRVLEWYRAEEAPITRDDVERLVAADPELRWSSSDYVDRKRGTSVTRYPMISWKGYLGFWWDETEISCKNPGEDQIFKLIQMADRLGAFVVGDDGERYEIRRNIFLRPKVVTISPGQQ